MGFEALKKPELLQTASDFGVEVKENATNKEIVAALVEDGVTWEAYTTFYEKTDAGNGDGGAPASSTDPDTVALAPDVVAEPDVNLVLVRMTRKNGTFEARGYKFTKAHPYALVKEDDADALVEEVGGFRIATPKEAKEYYS